MTQRTPPRWHQSAPRPNPKSRPYAQPAEAPAILTHPGDIIPESWARINRNAGRQLIGTGGRHHLGIDGRLAPESAADGQLCPEQPGFSFGGQAHADQAPFLAFGSFRSFFPTARAKLASVAQ